MTIINKLLKIVSFVLLPFAFSSCYNGPQENCVFISERANLHKEYYVTVLDADDYDSIEILRYEGETNKSELIGTSTHYVGVKVLIEHQNFDSPKEEHSLDLDDFKIKDHTGVQLGNLNLFSNENGLALETKNFDTTKPIKDYTWFGHNIESGDSLEITLYYELSKQLSVYDTVMVLEFDFFSGRTNGKSGTDIVLAYRSKEQA